MKEENKATEKSLGIIRPDPGTIKFKARRLSSASEDDVQLQAAFKQVSFIEPNALPELSVEYDFSYRFTSAGHPHEMKIHDWEVQAAYFKFKLRYADRALDMLRQEYEEKIPQRNLHFVMGTMKAHPRQFIIIGLLRSSISPEDAMRQGALL